MRTVIEKEATMKLIDAALTKNNAVKNDYNNYSNLNITVVDEYYSNNLKFRVYITGKKQSFVQSTKDGELNIEKLVAKVNEINTANNSYWAAQKKKREKNDAIDDMVKEMNVELEKKGYRASTSYGHNIVISKKYGSFNDEEMKAITAALPKLER